MKEKLLVLAKAAPEASKKYEELVCVAGITDKGEWRRIYPIPWEIFWKTNDNKFKKKQWIEYELKDDKPSDHRKESRKIIPESIVVLGDASYTEIEQILNEKLTTLEELTNNKDVSLGVIRPKTIEDYIPITNKQYEKILEMGKQTTLYGDKAYKLEPPEHKYQYIFTDEDSKEHKILCEDWESVMLYLHCKKDYSTFDEVHVKVKEKMLKVAQMARSYFIIGTHYRFNTNIIIGVIYPKKNDV